MYPSRPAMLKNGNRNNRSVCLNIYIEGEQENQSVSKAETQSNRESSIESERDAQTGTQ